VLTERARAEACRRVGKDAHTVAAVARDLGVGWATVMRAVQDHGRSLVEDPARLDGVAALGLDETSFLKATRLAPTRYVTGLVDLEGGRLLDVVADRTRAAVDGWLGARPAAWLAQVGTVALDPWHGYASALVAPLGHARVVDHFHAVRLANLVVDQVRRRTQQATLGHRGRKQDPLYRIRKLLLVAAQQLTGRGRARLRAGLAAGDPGGEVAAAWQGKELLRAVYAADGMPAARAALDPFYHWADGVEVAELARLARTVRAWEAEILAWHATDGCSNGPIEAVNLLTKKVKRVGHGFRNFSNYRCCCCTAGWHGKLTGPQACEAAPHAWWPVNDNAPSADRIVCRGRAGEHIAPPRASVSDSRQPTEWEIEAAATGGPATSQGGVWIRIASSGRADEPGQRTVSSASLAWRALCLLADAQMLPPWEAHGRGHWAQLPRDPRPLLQKAGERRHQAKSPLRPGLVLLLALRHLPAAPLLHCAARWQTHRTTSLRGRSHAWWRRASFSACLARSTTRSTFCLVLPART